MITNEKHEFTYQLTVDKTGSKIDVSGPYLVNGRIDSVRAGRAAILRLAALIEELTPSSETWEVHILQPDAEKSLGARLRVGGFRGTVFVRVAETSSAERVGEVMRKALTVIEANLDRKVLECATRLRTTVVHESAGATLGKLLDERVALLNKVWS